jgi:hypothetical protein
MPEIAIYITSPYSKHLQRRELRQQSKSLLRFPPFASAIASIEITSDFLRALTGMSDMFRAGWVFYSSDVMDCWAEMIREGYASTPAIASTLLQTC